MEEFAAVLQYSVPAIVMAAIAMVLVGIVKLFIKGKYQSPWLSKLYFGLAIAFAFGVAGCGGGGGSSGDPTPKKRRSKSACSGDCQSGDCRNDSTETSWVRYEG